MRQLIAPNPNIPCQPGWCLQYVRQAFGLPARYGTATEAWEKSASQHRDRDFPPGVWIPVWYGLDREPAGHVVLMAPNGNVYSTSDLGSVPHLHPDLADLERYYAYYGMTLTYRGWTEDVAGYPVIEGAGLAAMAGTITPLDQEDFLMALPDSDQIEMRDNLRKLVLASDQERALDEGVNEKVDELVGNSRKTFWNSEESKIRLQNGSPAQIAVQINAAGIAADVRDELVKLLGGK